MSRLSRDRGAAAVEFALLLPLLMMLLLAIMEFGYAFFIQASVAGAARLGVRYYAVHWNDKDPVTASQAADTAIAMAKSAMPDPNKVRGTPVFTPACSEGTQTTLIITYEYHSMTGLLDSVLAGNVSVTGKGSMQCGG